MERLSPKGGNLQFGGVRKGGPPQKGVNGTQPLVPQVTWTDPPPQPCPQPKKQEILLIFHENIISKCDSKMCSLKGRHTPQPKDPIKVKRKILFRLWVLLTRGYPNTCMVHDHRKLFSTMRKI